MPSKGEKNITSLKSQGVNAFLTKVNSTPLVKVGEKHGRLIFGMDATASREPSWEQARQIQAEMFSETTALGGLEVQLCYYRGLYEFNASPWYGNATQLLQDMNQMRLLLMDDRQIYTGKGCIEKVGEVAYEMQYGTSIANIMHCGLLPDLACIHAKLPFWDKPTETFSRMAVPFEHDEISSALIRIFTKVIFQPHYCFMVRIDVADYWGNFIFLVFSYNFKGQDLMGFL